ncbi:hypothetical protein G9A89_015715 [Geosiphon pyriformis]|nr:hypothetical protein G9A89_015715 [Geosiphon pyriformis]
MFDLNVYGYEHERVIKALNGIGIRTETDLLFVTDEIVLSQVKFYPPRAQLEAFRAQVVRRLRAVPKTGLNILNEKENCQPLSTGCFAIDKLFSGGMYPGEVSEISGPTATGKTQLAFFAAITTITSSPDNNVLFIDTSNCFSAQRVSSLFLNSDRFVNARDSGMDEVDLMEKLRVSHCFDIYAVMDAIQAVADSIAQEREVFYSNLRLIIIDSITAILSSLLTISTSQGHSLMLGLSRMLHTVAKKHQIAVLVINSAVRAHPNNSMSAFSSTMTKPALGLTWTYLPKVQLHITHCPHEFSEFEADEGPKLQEYIYTNRDGMSKWADGASYILEARKFLRHEQRFQYILLKYPNSEEI